MRELNPAKSFNINDETWENLTERLLNQHFLYGRQPLYPVISCIITDLQTVCEIYRSYGDTCINLLEQVMMDFSQNEYEDLVLGVIESKCEEQPALWPLVDSLRNLRKYIGDYPSDLNKTFHREISMLPGESKTTMFAELVEDICRTAVQETVDNINQQTLSIKFATLEM